MTKDSPEGPRHRATPASPAASTVGDWLREHVLAVAAGVIALIVLVVAIGDRSLFSSASGAPGPVAAGPSTVGAVVATDAPQGAVTPSLSASPHPPSASPSPHVHSPSPTRTPTATAVASSAKSTQTATASATPTNSSLTAAYRTSDSWGGGYTGEITVTAAARTFPTWSVTITLPGAATVSRAWGAEPASNGQTVTFTPESWDTQITPGSPITFGFQVAGAGTAPPRPVSCRIGSSGCSGL